MICTRLGTTGDEITSEPALPPRSGTSLLPCYSVRDPVVTLSYSAGDINYQLTTPPALWALTG